MSLFNNGFATTAEVCVLRDLFPRGCIVRLQEMVGEDETHYPQGLLGSVRSVDDSGQVHVSWEGSGSLALSVSVDTFDVLTCKKCLRPVLATAGNVTCPTCGWEEEKGAQKSASFKRFDAEAVRTILQQKREENGQ